MASITLNPTGQNTLAHSVSGGSNYSVLADDSDSSYIYKDATTSNTTTTSVFQIGNSSSIGGRFRITGISTTIRNKNGISGMNTSSMAANLFIGGIEGTSWSCSLSTSWSNRSHTSNVSEFSNLNGKVLTSLPQILLHIATTLRVSKTGSNKWNGASKASVTLTYDNLYSQSAQGSTGVSTSLSNSGSSVNGYYISGTTTTYTATLSNGYGFKGWFTNSSGTGTAVSTNLVYSETCNSDRTLYAIAFTVSVSGSTGVSASVSRGSDGRTFTFTGTLTNGYDFDGWYNGSSKVSSSNPYSVTLSSNTSLTAKANRHIYNISAVGDAHCTATVSSSDNYYGTVATFTATMSDSSYLFDGWYNDSSFTSLYSSSMTTTYTITSDKTLYVKTKSKSKFFIKTNGQWTEVIKAYRKVGGSWQLLSTDDYSGIFSTTDNLLKDDNRVH